MGETKPKYGAKNIVKHCSVDGTVIDEIKRKTNFDIDKDAAGELKRACERFLGRLGLYSPQNRVRRSQKAAALREILYRGKGDGPLPALIKKLKGLDPHTKTFLRIDTELSDFSDPAYCLHFSIDDIVLKLRNLGTGSFRRIWKTE